MFFLQDRKQPYQQSDCTDVYPGAVNVLSAAFFLMLITVRRQRGWKKEKLQQPVAKCDRVKTHKPEACSTAFNPVEIFTVAFVFK